MADSTIRAQRSASYLVSAAARSWRYDARCPPADLTPVAPVATPRWALGHGGALEWAVRFLGQATAEENMPAHPEQLGLLKDPRRLHRRGIHLAAQFSDGTELKTQNGRCDSSLACLRRRRLASRRQRFMYTALPSTTASWGSRVSTFATGVQSTVKPSFRSVSATTSAISAVDPRFDA